MNLLSASSPTFAAKAVQNNTLMYDLRAELNGEERYFIIKVPSAKREAFLKAVEKDAGYRLEEYGQILYRGWGEPDEELKAKLRDEYGMYQRAVQS